MLVWGCWLFTTPLDPFAYFHLCCLMSWFVSSTWYYLGSATPLEPFSHFELAVLAYLGLWLLSFDYLSAAISLFSFMLLTVSISAFTLIASWFQYPSPTVGHSHLAVLAYVGLWLLALAGSAFFWLAWSCLWLQLGLPLLATACLCLPLLWRALIDCPILPLPLGLLLSRSMCLSLAASACICSLPLMWQPFPLL